jgi:hypothetical protein
MQCEQLTQAIANGSSAALAQSNSAGQFKIALAAAASSAENVRLDKPAPERSDIDLTEPRDAYVDALRKRALTASTVPPHSPARDVLVQATTDAIDAVNVLCTGER